MIVRYKAANIKLRLGDLDHLRPTISFQMMEAKLWLTHEHGLYPKDLQTLNSTDLFDLYRNSLYEALKEAV